MLLHNLQHKIKYFRKILMENDNAPLFGYDIFGFLYLPICARGIKVVVTRPCVTQESRIL